ncbi:hypothetical protein EYF80_042494 [Liparis tanakae]|uniref:Uncharacterized protein n=1 Tax=Liparis tanakae TaxID=230148 RepID=A0A4Z2G369_9TELE|nr:hypothetical protein EYF80_042494 [Liparis tanakae]
MRSETVLNAFTHKALQETQGAAAGGLSAPHEEEISAQGIGSVAHPLKTVSIERFKRPEECPVVHMRKRNKKHNM